METKWRAAVVRSYDGWEFAGEYEEGGYLPVSVGEQVDVLSAASEGHASNRFATYVFARRASGDNQAGWLPTDCFREAPIIIEASDVVHTPEPARTALCTSATPYTMQHRGYTGCSTPVTSIAAPSNADLDCGARQQYLSSRNRGSWKRRGWHVAVSKALATVLRHSAHDHALTVQPDGYCRLDDILRLSQFQKLNCTTADVVTVVRENDKERFEIMSLEGELHIRASQGHSLQGIDDEKIFRTLRREDQDLPNVCFHGTYWKHVTSIKEKGLLAGGCAFGWGRNHIHFSSYLPGDGRLISGMRYDCECVIHVNLRRALEDGIPFYLSSNKVILSPGIRGVLPKKYIIDVKAI